VTTAVGTIKYELNEKVGDNKHARSQMNQRILDHVIAQPTVNVFHFSKYSNVYFIAVVCCDYVIVEKLHLG